MIVTVALVLIFSILFIIEPTYLKKSYSGCHNLIYNFEVSDACLLEVANSGQTSIKLRELTCDVEPPPLKNSKNLTMKLEVEYLFQMIALQKL